MHACMHTYSALTSEGVGVEEKAEASALMISGPLKPTKFGATLTCEHIQSRCRNLH